MWMMFRAQDSNGKTSLHHAVDEYLIEHVKFCVASLTSKHALGVLELEDNYGETAVHHGGYANILEILLRNGAALMVTDNDDNTSLHAAVRGGCTKAVDVILSHPESEGERFSKYDK